MSRLRKRFGLTMIELLVILGFLAMVLGFLLPALARVRSAASRAQSRNHLMQMALALHGCNDVYKQLPPTVGPFPPKTPSQGTLFFYLLPYIEQDNVYRQAQGSVWKNKTYSMRIPIFLNSQDGSAPPDNLYQGWLATTSYAANWMVFKQGGAAIPRTFHDGTSTTIVFAERYQMCHGHPCAWGYGSIYYWAPMFAYYSKGKFQVRPSQEQCNPALAQAMDPAGIQVAMGDGSCRLVADSLSPLTWGCVCNPGDGNVLGADW